MICRILIFLVLKCLMLPCDPGVELGHDYDFREYKISYDYQDY